MSLEMGKDGGLIGRFGLRWDPLGGLIERRSDGRVWSTEDVCEG